MKLEQAEQTIKKLNDKI